MTNAAFGLPANVNIYVTPPATKLSVPLHTDRQDVLVLQTSGKKRWRVYPPPPRKAGADPLNRGKSGDILGFDEYHKLSQSQNNDNDNEEEQSLQQQPNCEDMEKSQVLLDVVLKEGDVLYVPTGFPHTTDTITVVNDNEGDSEADIIANDVVPLSSSQLFNETSIHLTMGLDTHVWALTYAHLRWCLLQRCGKEFKLNITDDDLYWRSIETIPIGFLKKNIISDEEDNHNDFVDIIGNELKQIMIELEPNRWILNEQDKKDASKEELPDPSEFQQVVSYILENHLKPLFAVQDEMFRNVNPRDDNTIVKAYHGTQKQNKIMEAFSKFSNNLEMEANWKQVRESQESRVKDSMK